jgi:glycosyltransferase involved in cell wall biosynthesis
VSDYPLIVLFVGRIMNKRLIDFIGGSRFYLSQLLIYSRTHFSRRIAGLYRVIALKLSLKFSRIIVLITDSLINMDPFSEVLNKTHVGLNFPPSKFYNDFKISKEYHKRDNVIGYAGKFTKAKGVHLFAHAVERLSEDNNIKILFIGDYQNSEPPLLGLKIKEIFKGKKNVAFIGQVPHKNMPYYLNEMKLLVLPSFSEGIPHIIIEAMACGTPVAAHPVGGIPLLLRNGQYGYILSSRSPPILGKEISEAFGNTQNCELSEQISSYVRREYNYEKTVEMWKRILGTKRKDEKQWKKES